MSRKLARSLLSGVLFVAPCLIGNAWQVDRSPEAVFSEVHSSQLPANGRSCSECHSAPVLGGSSRVTVNRAGRRVSGHYEAINGAGILHKLNSRGEDQSAPLRSSRVSLILLGDGYVEAVPDAELEVISRSQVRATGGKIHGEVVYVSPVEVADKTKSIGRFGWKSQHATVLDAVADALRNELGVPNRIFGENLARMDLSTGRSRSLEHSDELDKLVEFVRDSEPIAPDPETSATEWAQAGSRIFDRIGCSICHVRTLATAPAGAKLGSNLVVSKRLGSKEIHPFSDYLLHDVGTGDGIVQNILPEDYKESTAKKFRTAPLWGVRFRAWMMHDGKSVTYHQAIMRHGGEATDVIKKYRKLTPIEKEQLRQFLDSL